MATEFDEGLLVGVLIGEGSFGGDGKQPQVTLRMHTRHLALFRWIDNTFPGGRLYGPYNHDGRHYYQWMARGNYLREILLPILDRRLTADLDGHSYQRFQTMRERYARRLVDTDSIGDEIAEGVASPMSVPRDESPANQADAIFDSLRHNDD